MTESELNTILNRHGMQVHGLTYNKSGTTDFYIGSGQTRGELIQAMAALNVAGIDAETHIERADNPESEDFGMPILIIRSFRES